MTVALIVMSVLTGILVGVIGMTLVLVVYAAKHGKKRGHRNDNQT